MQELFGKDKDAVSPLSKVTVTVSNVSSAMALGTRARGFKVNFRSSKRNGPGAVSVPGRRAP